MKTLPPAFAAMAAYKQFLCYALRPSAARPGKTDKIPLSPYSGQVCSPVDPSNWTTAEHACAVATAWGAGYGVAFTFTEGDPFFFVDIDGAFADGQWSPTAIRVAGMFPGAAMEISSGGTGMHIFGRGTVGVHGKKNSQFNLEFYTELRFVALTGVGAMGDASTDHTAALQLLAAEFFPSHGDAVDGGFLLSDGPVPEWRGPIDDAELIRRALNSRSAASAFGSRASFADLWEGNVDALSKAFPDPARAYDANAADAALIAHLSFWCGRDGERIMRLMTRANCALRRDKWFRGDGTEYMRRSISAVLARPGDVLTDKLAEPPSVPQAVAEAPAQTEVTGNTFLSPAAQKALFNGCVYVEDRHRVLVPGGKLLKPDQFRVAFGGYAFCMDAQNERTTRNAWEAFTESQVLRAPRADTICFKPDLPSAVIVNDAGRLRVNTWWPASVRRIVGDVTPFMTHIRKLLPDERDAQLLLSYMAACVQHKGVKFQWAPVIQGVEGNGKSILSACVAEAIGQHYTHWVNANSLLTDFNAYLANTVFLAIEELQDNAFEVVEKLKTIIGGGLGSGNQIQPKGIDQTSMAICCNGMITTNFRGSIRRTPDTARRYGNFFTAQQTRADLERDGMGGDYFPKFIKWLGNDGFAIVAELLHTYPIASEFNPAGALHRAPQTSTTALAIVESRGGVEQQIAEVIAQDTPGFMGGWISSVMLDKLVVDTLKMGNRLSYQKRKEILHGMGYVLHPGLAEGRVNNPVQPDGRKPQLFVLANSAAARLMGAAEIAKAYTQAQTITVQTWNA